MARFRRQARAGALGHSRNLGASAGLPWLRQLGHSRNLGASGVLYVRVGEYATASRASATAPTSRPKSRNATS